MTEQVKAKHTPGPDERGNYWMDCGCMVNGIMAMRCSLHAAAPDLLEAAKLVVAIFDRTDEGDEFWRSPKAESLLRSAIAKAEAGH